MSEHREWDEHYAYFQRREELRNEHNATVRAYRDAMAECERLGKANGEACDRIHALEKWKQETLDENNRLDRELDEARQSLKALESRPVLTWEECEEEFYHVCGHFPNSSQGSFMGWLKSRLPAPTDSIRVPFSDKQIERMCAAACDCVTFTDVWAKTQCKEEWYSAIRAALAAGGLVPCADHIGDANKMVPHVTRDEIEAVINDTMTLHSNPYMIAKDYANAIMGLLASKQATTTAVPERASDEELDAVFEQGCEGGALLDIEGVRAVRARVEAPLLAEIAEHRRHVGIVMSRESATRSELDALKAHSESLTNALIEAKRQRDTSESKLRSIELPRVNSYAFIKALDDAREATRNHNSGPYGAKEKCPKCFGTGKVFVAGGPERVCTDCLVPNGEPSKNTGELPALDERDTLNARVAELEAGKAGWCELDRGNLLLEMAELREKMGAVKEELVALRPWLR